MQILKYFTGEPGLATGIGGAFWLSGSGEAGPYSDIDLFTVLERAPYGMTHRRTLLENPHVKL